MIWWLFNKKKKPTAARTVPIVKFDTKRVTPAIEKMITQKIRSIRTLNPEQKETLIPAAIESVSRGRDLHVLSQAAIDIGLSQVEAAKISRKINDLATSKMNIARQLDLGITHATWAYSGAPCITKKDGSRKMDDAHKAANGQKYALKTGLKINGRYEYPGEKYGCKCISRPFIPGFDD